MARRLVLLAACLVVCVTTLVADAGVRRVKGARTHVGRGSVAAGRAHTVLAAPDGRVFTWGAGGRGQLGNGVQVGQPTPQLVPNLEDIVFVAAGAAHTVAVSSGGDVFAWGANQSGRLGDGTEQRRVSPVRVQGLSGVKAVAAGRAHTLALTADGAVYAWGANASGQVGNGKKAVVRAPVRVPGLANVVSIAAGEAHSLAVTSGGQLYAWGRNDSSALGDGTTKDRSKPTLVALSQVEAVAAGAAHTIALLKSGEVYAWGRGANGQLGTGTTGEASTPRQITGLKATAVAAGRQFSAALLADGRVMTWGANAAGQLGDGTTKRRLRPTIVPGLTEVVNLALGSAHAIAATSTGDVRSWGNGGAGRLGNGSTADTVSPGEIMSDLPDWGMEPDEEPDPEDEAEPEAPSIEPPTGVYPQPQNVTISPREPGHTVRFTTDGTEPTNASTIYEGPFLVAASAMIIARSFSASGLAGVVAAEALTIDTIAPVITATASPASQGGWATSPVTVTFECSDNVGVATCPPSIVVDEDVSSHTVSGVAVDRAGHSAHAAVVVSVDVNPPQLTIEQPRNGDVFFGESVELAGRAVDAGSGLIFVLCNGAWATVENDGVTCTVALQPGANELGLMAMDLFGRMSSVSVTVTRAIKRVPTLSPAVRTMVVGETSGLTFRDEEGALLLGASWSTSDEEVVAISADDPPVLTAVAPGEATVSAARNGMTVEAAITVVPALLAGNLRWALPSIEGSQSLAPIFANRVSVDSPHLFAVDSPAPWSEATLRGVSDDGEVLWQQHVAGVPLMGDSFGGVVIGLPAGGGYRGYQRIGGGTTQSWRYESPGLVARPGQSRDGTIYAREAIVVGQDASGRSLTNTFVTVIDGRTGSLISRTLIPNDVEQYTSAKDGHVIPSKPPIVCRSYRHEKPPTLEGPVVGADGKGYWLVRRYEIQKWDECNETQWRPARSTTMALEVLVVAPGAAPHSITVQSTQCAGAERTLLPCDLPLRPYQIMPDAIGGTLVTWESGTDVIDNRDMIVQRWLGRIDEAGQLSARPVFDRFSLEYIGQAGTALVWDGQWTTMDVRTGAVQWSRPLGMVGPIATRPDGGAAAIDHSNGELVMLDATGSEESRQSFGLAWQAANMSGNWIGVKSGQLSAVVGDVADATRFASLDMTGTRQQRVRTPGKGIWLKTHNALGPLPHQHVSIRVTPDAQDELLQNRHRFENCGEADACVPLGEDLYGNRFFTIGAGPAGADTSVSCDGLLRKGFNRPSDVTEPSTQPMQELPMEPWLRPIFVNSLLARFDDFTTAFYYCFPEDRPGFYNSNSFVHGILHAAGVPHDEAPPTRLPMPGWPTPVPESFFFKK